MVWQVAARESPRPPPLIADAPSPASAPPIITVFHTAPLGDTTITVTRTADLAPMVRRVDDVELAEMLAGRAHATYLAADGSRKLWIPDG